MRALVKGILNAMGCRSVAEAIDGADALKEMKHFSPDLIICDWNMSPLDGMDFVRMVRTSEDSANPFVPIIMLTGHTETSRVMEARDAGVNEFLAKPISAEELLRKIKSIIRNPRAFIKEKGYFGPDRRRRAIQGFPQDRRKNCEAEGEINSVLPNSRELSHEEVSALLDGVGR